MNWVDKEWFETKFAAILAAIKTQGDKNMSTLDDKITAIQTAVAQLGTDLTKAIADLKAGQAPTQAQLNALDAIATSLTNLDTQAKAE